MTFFDSSKKSITHLNIFRMTEKGGAGGGNLLRKFPLSGTFFILRLPVGVTLWILWHHFYAGLSRLHPRPKADIELISPTKTKIKDTDIKKYQKIGYHFTFNYSVFHDSLPKRVLYINLYFL